jgi:hypothetical protein
MVQPHAVSPSREEKGIALPVSPLPSLLAIILSLFILRPQGRRVDMFIPLIPSPIHYLRDRGVIIGAFQRIKICLGGILGQGSGGLPGS